MQMLEEATIMPSEAVRLDASRRMLKIRFCFFEQRIQASGLQVTLSPKTSTPAFIDIIVVATSSLNGGGLFLQGFEVPCNFRTLLTEEGRGSKYSDLRHTVAGHTGQSSQLFPIANSRNAQFLATIDIGVNVATRMRVLTRTIESGIF